jgi:enamine deaminase RidA (YjgF/YER057c/UK114 family)
MNNNNAHSLERQQFTYEHVRIEWSRFKAKADDAVTEYHALMHVTNVGIPFEQQLHALIAAQSYLITRDIKAFPVFKRYFVSDVANQLPVLQAKINSRFENCTVSVVQQPPLNGSKVALWVYLKTKNNIYVDTQNNTTVGVDEHNGYQHLRVAGLTATGSDARQQTTAILRQYTQLLANMDCTLAENCLRTWFFMAHLDANYHGMVEARKTFFESHGLTAQTHYIASTGIEGRLEQPSTLVSLDAYAVKGLLSEQIKYLHAPTHLNPTHQYGVTFERGVSVTYGDRQHVFISGTASINNNGDVVWSGNINGQTRRMIANIEALLREAGATTNDVAQMIVYLRDLADYNTVKTILDEQFPTAPRVITLAAVCRPAWLIEAECIAIVDSTNSLFKPL